MKLLIRARAKAQIVEASSWYEQQCPGLGLEFARAAEAALALIARQPGAHAKFSGEIRRAPMRRFPFSFFYLEDGHNVVVLRCVHQRRNPITWPQ